jgi:predicted RND superfamily exporter protein
VTYQSKVEQNIFKREVKSSLHSCKAVIRRRSINTNAKKREEDIYGSRKIEETYSKITASPKSNQKLKNFAQRDLAGAVVYASKN